MDSAATLSNYGQNSAHEGVREMICTYGEGEA